MAQIKVEGTVHKKSKLPATKPIPLSAAVVKYDSAGSSGTVPTDDKGQFDIPGIDESADLSLVLLHETTLPKAVTKTSGELGKPLNLQVQPLEGPGSEIIGGMTLVVFVGLLVILTTWYLSTHRTVADDAATQYSNLVGALESVPRSPEDVSDSNLYAKLADVQVARGAVDGLRSPPGDAVSDLLNRIVTYRKPADAKNVDDLTTMIDDAVSQLRKPTHRFFWTRWPWLMFEAWSWGMLGVLLTKIVRIGWYLYSRSYKARGTWMHISHVVATPFLALIAVLVLSFVKLESDAQTIVDLANPLFMVITACLLSTNPWGLWDFILERGDAMRKKGQAAE